MIKRVSSSVSSFHPVEFSPGFNVILAERHQQSTQQDSRNGVGKSTLIEIIHFCLGAERSGLLVEPLRGWDFSLDLVLRGKDVRVTRRTDDPRKVLIEADTTDWPIRPTENDGNGPTLDVRSWALLLGYFMFGLSAEREKYTPSFRSLISYFARRGRGAFLNPFTSTEKQQEWDRQVSIAFLLDLAWEDARQIQLVKDRAKGFKSLKGAVKAGVLDGFNGSRGDLESQLVRLREETAQRKQQLETFQVHPQYREIEQRANQLTVKIHSLTDQNFSNRQILELYRKDLSRENPPTPEDVKRVYEGAGVLLSDTALRRLDEVEAFHRAVIANRREFLSQEVTRLESELHANTEEIERLSTERAALLQVIKTHRALDEYTRLQQLYVSAETKVQEVATLIENMKRLEQSTAQLRVDQAVLQKRAQLDYEERAEKRAEAVRLFNSNSEFLYEAPGKLIIDIVPNGFRFAVEIERSGSDGIDNMKIFCFDLMLGQLWAPRAQQPGFVIHDSRLFDGVDERQRALALQLAERESRQRGFQYICALNSDAVPWAELNKNLDLKAAVRMTLSDLTPEQSLLGVRY